MAPLLLWPLSTTYQLGFLFVKTQPRQENITLLHDTFLAFHYQIDMSAPNPPRPLTRPPFPTLQAAPSASNSAYQSFQSSTSSLNTPSPASAPLPSPSAVHPHQRDFFSSLNHQNQTAHQQHAQPLSPTQFNYQPNREGAGRTAAETNNFLSQTALLAEAAKRAQMAVVMRDIEGMEL